MLALCLAWPATAHDDHAHTIMDTYRRFLAAQSARDLERVGSFFTDRPDFLWVSDGQSYWGREQVLARMSGFQRADVWQVTPDLDGATIVDLGARAAMMHFPLELEIGETGTTDTLGFLVSILFREEAGHWRIAALLTTRDKTPR